MKQKQITYGIIGMLSGILLTLILTNIFNLNDLSIIRGTKIDTSNKASNYTSSNDSHMMPDGSLMDNNHSMTMDDMTNSLKGKTGNDFDLAFITSMIEHHQGAIDMANLAKQYAGHNEIKNMAEDIISAQSFEINQMKQWEAEWKSDK